MTFNVKSMSLDEIEVAIEMLTEEKEVRSHKEYIQCIKEIKAIIERMPAEYIISHVISYEYKGNCYDWTDIVDGIDEILQKEGE